MSGMASVVLVMATLGGTPDGVVLDFSATWCPPCQSMVPIVERLQKQGYAIQKVDYDRNQQMAARYNVTHLPTFLLVVNGQVRQRFVGPMSENALRRMAASIPIKKMNAAQAHPKLIPKTFPRPKPTPHTKASTAQPKRNDRIVRANDNRELVSDPQRPVKPIAVCTRIRVRFGDTVDQGSGTVIYSEPGKTVILTCGHIFRGFNANSTIEVDLFHSAEPQTFDAKLIKADLDADIGLISLSELTQFPVAPIAPHSVQKGDHVYSIGCGAGNAPSRLQHLVTSTDIFQPDFVECTGMPVQGRSGGGLFTRDGEVVGVCVLADPESRRGLYTSLRTMHRLLDRCNLSSIAPRPELDRAAPAFDSERNPRAAIEPPRFVEDGAKSQALDLQRVDTNKSDSASSSVTNSEPRRFVPRFGQVPDGDDLPNESIDAASLSKLQEALAAAKGAEVICLIRSKGDPNKPNRIVIIHEASDRFVADLASELTNQVRPTSRTVRRHSFLQTANIQKTIDPMRYQRTSRKLPRFLPTP
jgi:thiol-disulfide isomerase/thioredoxin